MHEITIATKLVDDLRKRVDISNIVRIEIELGELSEITKDELYHGLRHIFKDHMDQEVDIIIEVKQSLIRCNRCFYKGKANIIERGHELCIFNCPICNNFDVKVISGKDIKIKNIEINR